MVSATLFAQFVLLLLFHACVAQLAAGIANVSAKLHHEVSIILAGAYNIQSLIGGDNRAMAQIAQGCLSFALHTPSIDVVVSSVGTFQLASI